MAKNINHNKVNNSTLVTISVKAGTTKADANKVIRRRRESVRAYVENNLKELGISRPLCDLGYGLFSIHHDNPYDDIINIANQVNNAYMSSWGLFFKYVQVCRELAEIKGRKIEDAKYEENY